jgi:hypothetical protein
LEDEQPREAKIASNLKITIKIALISVLLALSIFAAHLGGFLQASLPQLDDFVSNPETTNVSQYIDGNTPIALGKLEKAENAHFLLKLRFRVDSAEGYPNLFQTAPVNSGLRIEISGSAATIIVADSSVNEGYRVIGLSNAINIGQWYQLEIEALNGNYVRAVLDEQNVADVSSTGISMEVSRFLVGGGFDETRVFRGQIDNISIKKGNIPSHIAAIARYIPRSLHSVLSVIANAGILLSILLCLFIIKANRIVGKVSNYFRRLDNIPITTIASLTFCQVILMYALPAYRHVAITYVFLFLIGINIYLTLTPTFLKERFFYLLWIPFNGFLLLSVLGGYFIGFSIDIKYLVPTLLAITTIGLLLNFMFNKNQFNLLFTELKVDSSITLIYFTLIATPLILLLISPVLFAGHATSPYRIGPDMALYAKMAQYLLDGGTWIEANLIASDFTGMSPGEINRYSDATMSWPLMYYFRWGLTAFQATVATITSSRHVYETIFISMVIPYLFLCGLVLVWLKSRMGLGVVAALLGAIAFALNPNMINLWYEGFYGNTFSLCFFILILLMFINIRGMENFKVKNNIQSILLLSLVFAASLLSYGEGVFFVALPLFAFVFIVDFLMNRSINWSPYLLILGSACIGLLIVLPGDFIVHWAILTLKQLTEEGGNGYMQPLWALPHEIFGFSSIYLNATPDVAGKLLSRSALKLIAGLIFSCMILYSLFLYFKSKNKEENTLYITSILLVAVSACLVYYKSRDNNYTYMKTYVFFLPILFIIFWSSLIAFYEKHVLNKISKNLFFLFLSIPIAINGIVYIFQYKDEATLIEKYKIALHGELKHINFDNVIMYPASMHTLRTMYPAILPTPWIVREYWNSDRWKDKPYYKNFINHKVYLFVEKEPGHSYEIQNGEVVFQNQCCLIVDSGKTVRDGINNEDKSVDFDVYTISIK